MQRFLLAALFIFVATLQIRFSALTIDMLASPGSYPAAGFEINPVTLALPEPPEIFKKANLHKGDILVGLNGHPVSSYFQGARIYYSLQPGKPFTATFRRGSAPPFTVSVTVPGMKRSDWLDYLIPIVLNIVTPWSCILLGFLVAFRRIGDPVAYAVLALLYCVSQLLKANSGPSNGWEPLFSWSFLFIGTLSHSVLLVVWLWFCYVFPDPKSKYKLFPRLGWILGGIYLLEASLVSFSFTANIVWPHSAGWLFKHTSFPGWLDRLWTTALAILGFANLGYKLFRETQCTVRRRLQWLAFGLAIGLVPTLLLLLIAGLLGKDLDDTPMWLLVPIVFTPVFVPITLAYAVIVDRLFDVGVFVRQGLLATKTIAIVRLILFTVLISLTVNYQLNTKLPAVQRWAGILLCLAAVIFVGRLSKWARRWVDRHFFQEAVNTEQLLLELSNEVRRITNPQLLLQTVTDRIANALHVSKVAALIPNTSAFVPAYATGFADPPLELLTTDPIVRRMQQEHQPVKWSDGLFVPIGAGPDGILTLGPKRSEEPYSGQDIRLLETVASQTALALENSRLTAAVEQEAAERQRITSELEIARTVQQRLLPRCAPTVPGLDLAGFCQPAQTVGGDYFDFLETPSGAVGLAIGDVAGKGVPAALVMAALQASLRGLTLAGISNPADLLAKLNILVYDSTPVNRFATFFYGLYDPTTHLLRYSSAGHNPVVLYRPATNETLWLKTPGVGLGLKRNSKYQQAEICLCPGDYLVLYTDGVTEARNVAEEDFGEDRLVEVVRRMAGQTASEVLTAILEATNRFASGTPQFDDLTLIVAHARQSLCP